MKGFWVVVLVTGLLLGTLLAATAKACGDFDCPTPGQPQVGFEPGSLTASSVSGEPGQALRAASTSPSPYSYELLSEVFSTDWRRSAFSRQVAAGQRPERCVAA